MIKIISFIIGFIHGGIIGILLMHLSQINKEEKEQKKLKEQKNELDTFLESWRKVIKKENIKTAKDAIIESKSHRQKLEERIKKNDLTKSI